MSPDSISKKEIENEGYVRWRLKEGVRCFLQEEEVLASCGICGTETMGRAVVLGWKEDREGKLPDDMYALCDLHNNPDNLKKLYLEDYQRSFWGVESRKCHALIGKDHSVKTEIICDNIDNEFMKMAWYYMICEGFSSTQAEEKICHLVDMAGEYLQNKDRS